MLTLDAIVKRATLAAIAGMLASLVFAPWGASLTGLVAFYVLLVVHSKPVNAWRYQPPSD